jgi:hypothetical protein
MLIHWEKTDTIQKNTKALLHANKKSWSGSESRENRQLSIIQGNGREDGHGQPKTMVKTKIFKTLYKIDLI